ncbi:putative GPI-anchored protein isoform X2 [Capsicum galapagoense]
MSKKTQILLLQVSLVLLFFSGFHGSLCTIDSDILDPYILSRSNNDASPNISPSIAPEDMFLLQAPSPLMPYTYTGVPKLSGHCAFNFSAADSILRTTSTDCWSSLAPYLANVVCCPQFDASLAVLVGQASSQSQSLALNVTHARHCLSDVEQILKSQGASEKLLEICSVDPSNLTESSCPVIDVNEVGNSLNASSLLASCEKIDPTIECCNQVCQNAISAAAEVLAFSGAPVLLEKSTVISDCKSIIVRWMASKFDPSSANRIIRVLSSCDINKSCPLVFPDLKNISKECGEVASNPTSCCNAMNSYLSRLQQQSFVTNLQALNCATLLGKKLQEANITSNIFDLCHVNLKDFSLQVDEKESGCLLPSLPTDLTYDQNSGIGFICDLNDNVAAPWSSAYSGASSTCNKTAALPELPKATSSQLSKGINMKDMVYALLFASTVVIQLLI